MLFDLTTRIARSVVTIDYGINSIVRRQMCRLGLHEDVVAHHVENSVWYEWSCRWCGKVYTGAEYRGHNIKEEAL